jgi:hypothetical protein
MRGSWRPLTASDAPRSSGSASQLEFRASFSGPFDILNENTLTLRTSYDRALSETSSLQATYSCQRVQPLGLDASTTHSLTLLVASCRKGRCGASGIALQIACRAGLDR